MLDKIYFLWQKQNSDDLYNHLFRVAMADGSLKLDSVCDPNVTGVEKSGAIQITEAVVFSGISHVHFDV